MVLIAIAAVLQVIVAVMMIARVTDAVTSGQILTMPGAVVVDCRVGDDWRIGPQTATTSQAGPITVTNGFPAELGDVTAVTSAGSPVQVSPYGSNHTETMSLAGITFTAVATFTCPSDGPVTVTLSGPTGASAAVFPSIGGLFDGLIPVFVLAGVSLVLGLVGMVLAISGRRRPVPVAPLSKTAWPAPPSR
jgi:hypothetical protein